MELITLGTGIVIGLLLNPIKQKIIVEVENHKKTQEQGKAQFYEPMSDKEKFEKSGNLDELLESYKK